MGTVGLRVLRTALPHGHKATARNCTSRSASALLRASPAVAPDPEVLTRQFPNALSTVLIVQVHPDEERDALNNVQAFLYTLGAGALFPTGVEDEKTIHLVDCRHALRHAGCPR